MADIQLMHGNDDFYPSQIAHDWRKLDRVDRKIYFLSNKVNSCADIAFLLKKERTFVRNRLCVLFLLGYVSLNINIRFDLIERSLRDLQEYKKLCVLYFYTLLQEQFSIPRERINKVQSDQIESEFFSMLYFAVQVIEQQRSDIVEILLSIISAYHLQSFTEELFDIVIQDLAQSLAYCLQDDWSNDLEIAWKRICGVLKYALIALLQQI